MRRLSIRGQLLRQAMLVVVGVFVLAPVWVLILMATDGSLTGYPTGFHLLPVNPDLDRFARGDRPPVRTSSTTGACCATASSSPGPSALASLVFGASMAYAFARLRFPGSRGGLLVVLLGAFLPPVALALPLFILFITLERSVPALEALGLPRLDCSPCRSSTRRSPCRWRSG